MRLFDKERPFIFLPEKTEDGKSALEITIKRSKEAS
jgi:hypothetical protein